MFTDLETKISSKAEKVACNSPAQKQRPNTSYGLHFSLFPFTRQQERVDPCWPCSPLIYCIASLLPGNRIRRLVGVWTFKKKLVKIFKRKISLINNSIQPLLAPLISLAFICSGSCQRYLRW
mgnify:CR=1 FL=1